MKPKKRYYIRIGSEDMTAFESYLAELQIEWTYLSDDRIRTKPTMLYSIHLDDEETLALKLKFQLLGCLNLKKALDNLKTTVHYCDDTETVLK